MKVVDLTQKEANKLQAANDTGDFGEKLAASEYGYNRFVQGPWFDARRKDTGAVIDAKATMSRIGDDYPADGRFRIFKPRHEKRLRYDRENSCFYVFVLFDFRGNSRPVARLKRKNPSEVGHIIGANGGWTKSGHESQGKQKKIPYTAIF